MTEAFLTLPCGRITVVDEAGIAFLTAYRWRSRVDPKNGVVYVSASIRYGQGRRRRVHLHRLVAGAREGEVTDHIDGDGLNNRRANLRRCQSAQNGRNRRKNLNSSAPYKGVCQIKATGRWRAGIKVNYKRIHLGCYATAEEEIGRAHV